MDPPSALASYPHSGRWYGGAIRDNGDVYRRRRCRDLFHGGDEAVAYAGNRFDVPGVLGRVTESLAKFLDGTIQTVLEIHECVRGPEPLLQILPGNDFARLPQ